MSLLYRETLKLSAPRRGLFEFTDQVRACVECVDKRDEVAFVHLFCRHTSAGLTIQENADPSARHDLELFFERLVPFDQPGFRHTAEGPDDMPSHIKTVMMDTSLTIPADSRGLLLGTWQGIYLWEHRDSCPTREIVISIGS